MAQRVRHNQDTNKLLEENLGKTFSDINHINIFLGQFLSRNNKIKSKNKPKDQIKLIGYCTAKENVKIKTKQNKTNYTMGEYSFK